MIPICFLFEFRFICSNVRCQYRLRHQLLRNTFVNGLVNEGDYSFIWSPFFWFIPPFNAYGMLKALFLIEALSNSVP